MITTILCIFAVIIPSYMLGFLKGTKNLNRIIDHYENKIIQIKRQDNLKNRTIERWEREDEELRNGTR
ncbi:MULTISPECIES: hypothetical protein [unclassified Enterococcus]|uniref:hypothetical protein n=1 Tax=unclassified Enterococcus TaxID=2608891 RepID=UPI0015557EB1|nr:MULTISPECIES: hypothetical protein [unclassified Enterococcus]MBS7578487.1 hypothetical protein [Enterococcus sp. MMGLQ5-2]MBS7585718.1 hypothetical protein [Enterococcus sp. MMGLQ5-1]NPD13577.1 hypothetical protein [Enterococcus sp. MMGLQ5-1]NPD38321.1 hypothetical protein [Enterococcus sp. MMGLQ5-2]